MMRVRRRSQRKSGSDRGGCCVGIGNWKLNGFIIFDAVFLLLLFYGCGPQYTNPNKAPGHFAADDKECRAAALYVYPPKLEWNSGEESLELRRRATRERDYHWWDANRDARSIVYTECMENKGWKKK